ncbi:IclR family transcriptional regulator [Salinicola halophyticus]|uniref:IclR family transcriptional regulator n=1 Tax=Salinicola halophyticus TaxID=1808881 RepID=UPI003F485D2F
MSGRGTERVLELIEWMSLQTEARSLTEIVAELGLPKSSVLMLLRMLVEKGYVARDTSSHYRLVRLPGEHSAQNRASGTLWRVAYPYLEEAVKQTQESAFLAVFDASERVTYLNKLLPEREIRYDRDITVSRVAEHVASGCVLLASLEPTAFEAYLARRLPNDSDSKLIRKWVEQTRNDGYAVNLDGRVEGASGLSAPIRDAENRCVAALNIAGPRERVVRDQSRIRDVLLTTAESISLALSSASAHYAISKTRE